MNKWLLLASLYVAQFLPVIFIGSMLAASFFSGFIAKGFGYLGAFAIAALLCLLGVLLVTTLDEKSIS